MNSFHVIINENNNNNNKNISSEKNILIHSYYSEKKWLNLKLFNLSCTYLYGHTSALKTQQTTILEN